MLTESHTCPISAQVVDLPVITADPDTYLIAETTNQGSYMVGKVSLPQAILNAGLPLLNNAVDTWVATNSANLKAAVSWFLANNVKVSRNNSWVQGTSSSITDSITWYTDSSSNITESTTWVNANSSILQTLEPIINDEYTAWVSQNSSIILNILTNVEILTADDNTFKVLTNWVVSNSSTFNDLTSIVSVISTSNNNNQQAIVWVNSVSSDYTSLISTVDNLLDYQINSTSAIEWVNTYGQDLVNFESQSTPAVSWVNTLSDEIENTIAWFYVLTAIKESHEDLEKAVFTWTTNNSAEINSIIQLDGELRNVYVDADNTTVYDWLTLSSFDTNQSAAWWKQNNAIVTQAANWVAETTSTWVSQIHFTALEVILADYQNWVESNSANIQTSITDLYELSATVINTLNNLSSNINDIGEWLSPYTSAISELSLTNNWVQNTSALYLNALDSTVWSQEASSTYADVLDTALWVQDVSSSYAEVLDSSAWTQEVSSSYTDILDSVTWTQDASASYSTVLEAAMWMQMLTSVYEEHSVIDQVSTWTQDNSASYDGVLESSTWTQDNSSSYADVLNTVTWSQDNSASYADVLNTVTWSHEISSAYTDVLESSTWTQDNSSSYADVLESSDWVIENASSYADVLNTVTWSQDNSASYTDVLESSTWTQDNSSSYADVLESSDWVIENASSYADVLESSTWTQDNSASYTDVLESSTWSQDNSSSFANVLESSTWSQDNSSSFANVLESSTWTQDNSSSYADVLESSDWVIENASSYADVLDSATWTQDNSASYADVLDTVTWSHEISSAYADVLDSATWTQDNSASFADVLESSDWVIENANSYTGVLESSTWTQANSASYVDVLSATAWVIDTVNSYNQVQAAAAWSQDTSASHSSILDSVTWSQSTSTSYDSILESTAWVQMLTSIYEDHDDLEQGVFSWVVESSGSYVDILESTIVTQSISSAYADVLNTALWAQGISSSYSDVLYATDWVFENTASYSDVLDATAWVIENASSYSDVLDATAWVIENAYYYPSILDAATWTQDNSSSYSDVLDATAWVFENAASYVDVLDAATWTQDNSATVVNNTNTISDITDVISDIQPAVTWVEEVSSKLEQASTWIQSNSGTVVSCHVSIVEVTDEQRIDITHSLSTDDVIVQVYDNNTKERIECVVGEIDSNSIYIEVGQGVTGTFKIVIFGNTNLQAQSDLQNDVSTWVLTNSSSIEETITWLNALNGNSSTFAQQQAAVFNWVHNISGVVTQYTTNAAPLLSWLTTNQQPIEQSYSWVQLNSSNLRTAAATAYLANTWITNHNTDIVNTVSVVRETSAAVSDVQNWLSVNDEVLNDIGSWVHLNSAAVPWLQLLTGIYQDHDELEQGVFSWVTENSANPTLNVGRTVSWIAENSATIKDFTTWYVPNSFSLKSNIQWLEDNKQSTQEAVTWTQETSTIVNTALTAIQWTYNTTRDTNSWILDVSAPYANANAWFSANSAVLAHSIDTTTEVATWVLSNSTLIGFTRDFVLDNMSDITGVVSWLKLISGQSETHYEDELQVHTWVQGNSSVQEVNTWVRLTSADIVDTHTWVVQNSDAAAWVQATSTSITSAVEWVEGNKDTVEMATQWVLSNQAASEGVTNTFPYVSANYDDAAAWVFNNGIYAYQASLWYISNSTQIDNSTTWVERNSASIISEDSWAQRLSSDLGIATQWISNNGSNVLRDINTLQIAAEDAAHAVLWVQDYENSIEDVLSLTHASSSAWTVTQQNSATWNHAVTSIEVWSTDTPVDSYVGNILPGQDLRGNTAIQILEKLLIGQSSIGIARQPQARTVNPGATVVMNLSAVGTDLRYQWFKQVDSVDTLIDGASTVEIILTNVNSNDQADYWARVSNNFTFTDTNHVTLTVRTSAGIVTQPTPSIELTELSLLTILVDVSGSELITYQWYRNNIPVNNATYHTYTVTNATTADSATYRVVATNLVNSVSSTPSIVHVYKPVTILTDPLSATLNPGQSTILTVSAFGSTPISYQWKLNGNSILNAITYNYVANAAGTYTVTVTNPVTSVTSQGAELVYRVPAVFTAQPTLSTTLNEPATLTLQGTVSGTAPINYQWRKNGALISGATSNILTVTPTTTADAGTYTLSASNLAGSAISNNAYVTILRGVSIITDPIGITLNPGQTTLLTVSAYGTSPITYQWKLNDSVIPSATTYSYTATAAGTYTVTVTNPVTSVTSQGAVVVYRSVPVVTIQPTLSTTLTAPSMLTLQVTVTGTAPISYVWLRNSAVISGATSNVLTITPTTTADAGTYVLSASNLAGSTTSNNAYVTIYKGVTITTHPASVTLNPGQTTLLTVSAYGTSPIAYQWKRDGGDIPGATTYSYTASTAGSYTVNVSNPINNVTSNAAVIVYRVAPAFTSQPVSTAVSENATAQLSSIASGTSPITYSWYKGGIIVPSQTTNIFYLTQAALTDAGDYYVVASNPAGSATSNVATLTVNAVTVYHDVQFTNFTVLDSNSQVLTTSACTVGQSINYNTLTFRWTWNSQGVAGDWYDYANPNAHTTGISYTINGTTQLLTAVDFNTNNNNGVASVTVYNVPAFTGAGATTLQFTLSGKEIGLTQPAGGQNVSPVTFNAASWNVAPIYWGVFPKPWSAAPSVLTVSGDTTLSNFNTYMDGPPSIANRGWPGPRFGRFTDGVVAVKTAAGFPVIDASTFSQAFSTTNTYSRTDITTYNVAAGSEPTFTWPATQNLITALGSLVTSFNNDFGGFTTNYGTLTNGYFYIFVPATMPGTKWTKAVDPVNGTLKASSIFAGQVTIRINNANITYDAYQLLNTTSYSGQTWKLLNT